ncbi:M23 family metallopeptidase [Prescottella equi]|uniref:Peptidase, M23 family n=1 Tax=Prescottella equi ATCC 33707 TaxID=525370 RepID=E9SW58_RHOHA|nr:M23 family metallopeptidase [Prescottella equi]EGD25804.1 peptidase, M23 family [Prescottella equi ATCC 33707]
MADNHSTYNVVAPTSPVALRSRAVKATAVAVTTGALLAGSVQIGAATASAAPLHRPDVAGVQLQLPAGQFLPGVDIPSLVDAVHAGPGQWTPTTAAWWKPAPKLQAPAPAPEPQSVPIPAPMPEPLPAPEAVPAPEPMPAPEVAPAPMPAPVLPPPRPAFVQPVAGFLTSSYGPRWGTHHNGIDIGANLGTPILSAADGVVIDAGPASGFGLWVRVQHTDGTITVYGHVDTFVVNVGQPVLAGELIATVGNRGQSTGPHLHLEVWNPAGYQVDPLIWLHDSGVAVNW